MLAERFQFTHAVGKLKARHGLPSRDRGREAEQVSRLRQLAAVSKLDPDLAEKFLAFVIREVIRHHESTAPSKLDGFQNGMRHRSRAIPVCRRIAAGSKHMTVGASACAPLKARQIT
jgi:chorismate mutase